MTEKQKEIIQWLCSNSEDKYSKGIALIQKYHSNKSIVHNFGGFISDDKKRKITYELAKLAGYTIPQYQQKKWFLDNPDLQLPPEDPTDYICPVCGETYIPADGQPYIPEGEDMCPDCLLKKKLAEQHIENPPIQDTNQNPSPNSILKTETEAPKTETQDPKTETKPLEKEIITPKPAKDPKPKAPVAPKASPAPKATDKKSNPPTPKAPSAQ